jgi:hypothetical protein
LAGADGRFLPTRTMNQASVADKSVRVKISDRPGRCQKAELAGLIALNKQTLDLRQAKLKQRGRPADLRRISKLLGEIAGPD